MKVLFIHPVPPAKYQILRFQQGIGSLSAVLKKAGYQTGLLVISEFEEDRVNEALLRVAPDFIAISLTSGFFSMAIEIARYAGVCRNLPVILGGVHPTLCPEESIAADGVMAVCRGEGEYPLLEFCEALTAGRDPTRIPNLWVKHGDRIYRNELRPLIANLDSLPFPDRELFRFDGLLKIFAEVELIGSRGCPYLCGYCVNHALRDLYHGKGPFVRYRSVDNILNEIASITRRYSGIGLLGFHDDTFTLNLRRLEEFAEKYPKRFNYPFWCNATADSMNKTVAGLLKKSGCYEVRIGVESGNDVIRMQVLNKQVSRRQIIRAFRVARTAGLKTFSFNMVGLPTETKQTINDTIRLNQEIRPDQAFCSIFYPYPGTSLRRFCEERGWLTPCRVQSYFSNEYALQQSTIAAHDVLWYHSIFRDLVALPWLDPLIRMLARIPVTRSKSVWNAWRRVRAKTLECLSAVAQKARKVAALGYIA